METMKLCMNMTNIINLYLIIHAKLLQPVDGNIHVADYHPDEDSGDTEINKKKPFRPEGIVTTQRDNVIVADIDTSTLHILNNSGELIKHIKTTDNGITYPNSLAFSQTGQLYIGCSTPGETTAKEAKII
ncbi:Hypothetical predicted protein [Mytilus galloprovincialis]|uniref:SMP-30/Gluconolactonase/LRE-like region domain-containing protein n=1 Tax=Mytilus galloprovincialis TaxID=29158 RepID=A0A8B6BTK4_MYTGA|nr:Hypothetical predicted protein [Mytilus galloprovincialis]